MKKFLLILMATVTLVANAQDMKLPAPQTTVVKKQPNMTVVEALMTRHSVRKYTEQKLSNQMISNVCWAAIGVQRDKDHRTNPTARNFQEIRLFVLTEAAAYEYIAEDNNLRFIMEGDFRKLMASNGEGSNFSQDFVMEAPVSLVLVYDLDLFKGGDEEHARLMSLVDAGIACQNINLYCQSVGLATVPRATMDIEQLREVLQLNDRQFPILNNPIGFEKR